MNQRLFYELGGHRPIVGEVDVAVCGGGPAGLATAVAAARLGVRTVLLEGQGCLGGIWTSGLLSFILDSANKHGVLTEFLHRVDRLDGTRPPAWGGITCDPEAVKLAAEQWCAELGVRVRLHTRVVAACRDDSDRVLRYAITESKSGREAWSAKVFVDCTGDGDLAAQAGCGFDLGRPGSGQTQPLSLIALLGGVPRAAIEPFLHQDGAAWRSDSVALCALLARRGLQPSYGSPILIPIHDGLYLLMANHQYGVSGTDADQLTEATVAARAELWRIVNALRASGEPWAGLRLVATASHIGVREGRRIHGRYLVTANDLAVGARHADAVCRVTFPVDIHPTDGTSGGSYSSEGLAAQPYDIPLRALLAADVDGLVMAGRCISGDFAAHASYRVTGNAVQMGEAAGTLAAVAAARGVPPHEVPFKALPGHEGWAG
ncbi:MAG: FAD-dependent oxidoreductase [Armatimonadetes bacterium]|nr:FAD-dependent oxidoreductase [Armatimonadota bacterium]